MAPIEWADGRLRLLDQTRLPGEVRYVEPATAEAVWEAIRALRVRGAPAIGIAAAFGLYLGVRGSEARTREAFLADVRRVAEYLATARPTAVNLSWALRRVQRRVEVLEAPVDTLKAEVLAGALELLEEDRRTCRDIGRRGAPLLAGARAVLTHCNAGGLATAQYGTALAPIYHLHEQGHTLRVYVDETRPLLQGARLTAWELLQAGIPVTLITDSMAAVVLRQRRVDAVIVGADRVASNGDTANKIGTYGLAVLAREHGVPLYVALPTSTFDFSLPDGDRIPIEERSPDEVTHLAGVRTAPEGVDVFNPAFDVTPAHLITAFITEVGVIHPPFGPALAQLRKDLGR
ncbi:S-methyl-5-thioribose-1-phosphate isomerase [Caldinitratiruptor microaerophilus]|uniref:S-methyl-5-thioribose-1-phosphate isomerase n=1 Tax=Caldinitratiruptor microaerophilus TaxID=671077 RepID=UPI0022302D6E|nr:S-methyl-5-thioribose-1-phosphate isomerase [Caldinitratiruptor microaerophilus]